MKSTYAQFVSFNIEILTLGRPWFVPIPNFVEGFDKEKITLGGCSNGRFVVYFIYETEGYDHDNSVKNSNKYLELISYRHQPKKIDKKYAFLGKVFIQRKFYSRSEFFVYGRIIKNFSLNEEEENTSL